MASMTRRAAIGEAAFRRVAAAPARDRPRERARPRALRPRTRRRRRGGGRRCAPRPRCGRCCSPRCSRTTAGSAGRPALLVTPDDRSARDLAADLRAYLAPRRVRYYPSRGTGYASHITPPPHLVGLRIDALDALSAEATPVVVASAVALAEAVPDASLRPAGFSSLARRGDRPRRRRGRLVAAGYERVEQVNERGQFAIRGGILDVFPATEERAVRVELFGDEIDSMRWFSTFTQRSLGEAERVELAPAAELDAEHRGLAELARDATAAERAGERARPRRLLPLEPFRAPLDLIAEGAAVILAAAEEIEPALRDHWEDVTTAMHDEDARHLYVDVAGPLADARCSRSSGADADSESFPRLAGRVSRAQHEGGRGGAGEAARLRLPHGRRLRAARRGGARPLQPRPARRRDPRRPPALPGAPAWHSPRPACARASSRRSCGSPSIPFRRLVHRRRRAEERGRARDAADSPSPSCGSATTSSTRTTASPASPASRPGRSAASPATTSTSSTRGRTGSTSPPTSSRSSPATSAPAASRRSRPLGGKRWQNLKARARSAAGALAGELLNLYAERRSRSGHAFPPDGEWQLAMEAAFPYRETADQIEAIDAVKADMEADRPMDRLVCGDVGYGKTEVALRAAVKAASDGRQVMMLVPTTILAQQHLGTFRERLADLPFVVERVSRLRKPAEVKRVLARLLGGPGRHPRRHPPAALARRARQGAGPADRRRGAALRGQAEGAAAPAEAEGRRSLALGHPDPAHPADVARRACATSR